MKNMVSKWTASLLAAALLVSSPLTAMAAELSSSEAADKETAESEQGTEAVEDVLLSEEISDVKLSDVQEIPEGVSIGDIEVGGLTGEEAAALVAEYFDQAGEATVRFLVDTQSMEKTLDELGLYWKNEGEISRTLYDVSRGNLLKQYKLVKDIENDMLDTEIQFAVEEEAAVALLDEDLLPLNVEPVNATFSRNSAGGWDITPEVNGIIANSKEAVALINAKLEKWDEKDFTITVPVEINRAAITYEMYAEIGTTPIAVFSTDYITDNASRNHNVELAASRINGRIFLPDEVISYNDMISPVTAASGYGYAGAYANGTVIQSIGGGICQLATTFYNCCLLLELPEVSRKNHSMAVGYVPYAMDATVSPGDGLDLKVINNTGHILYVECYTQGRDVQVCFYGKDDRDYDVRYRSITLSLGPETGLIETADPSLKPGTDVYDDSGHRSATAELWKDKYVKGTDTLISSEKVHTDSYRSSIARRRYGPAYDDNGTAYYINQQGYAVDEEGNLYRLNPDGTFLDDPLASDEEETTGGDHSEGENAGGETTAASEETSASQE